MVNTRVIGKLGEELAAKFLEEHGYKILTKNFSCKLGEIDLIAQESGQVVFIEVKARSTISFGLPQEFVNYKKQSKIRQVALYYLMKYHSENFSCRFDVVAMVLVQGKAKKIELIKNAF
ncbi:YraN family protein [Bacillota bacterium LX-D]|nr:YraN family protein [Bacillota bacterium LX-D]